MSKTEMAADSLSPVGRQPLNRARVAAAAIEIADERGLEAITMRNVAARLGSGTMSLYRHVKDRDELLDAILDSVYSGLELPSETAGDWSDRLRMIAHAQLDMLRAHPWMAALVGTRPPLSLGFLRSFEAALQTLLTAGLDINSAAECWASIHAFIVGAALLQSAETETLRRTEMTRSQWQDHNAPQVHDIMRSGDYPAITKFIIDVRETPSSESIDRPLDALINDARGRAIEPSHPC